MEGCSQRLHTRVTQDTVLSCRPFSLFFFSEQLGVHEDGGGHSKSTKKKLNTHEARQAQLSMCSNSLHNIGHTRHKTRQTHKNTKKKEVMSSSFVPRIALGERQTDGNGISVVNEHHITSTKLAPNKKKPEFKHIKCKMALRSLFV